MSVLDELKTLLVAQGVGTNETVFLGSRPDSPDDVVVLMEQPGQAPVLVHNQVLPQYERPQVQVLVRSEDYQAARTLVQQAWNALVVITNAVVGGTRYLSIRPTTSPAPIGRDANARFLLGFTVTILKELSA